MPEIIITSSLYMKKTHEDLVHNTETESNCMTKELFHASSLKIGKKVRLGENCTLSVLKQGAN